MGTGKMIHILQVWTLTRSALIRDILADGVNAIFIIILSAISIATIGIQYLLFAAIFLWALILFYFIFKTKLQLLQKERKNLWVAGSSQLVKIIMSKFEILQNNKINKELNIDAKRIDKEKKIVSKRNRYVYAMRQWPEIVLRIIQMLIIIFVGISVVHGKSSLWEFVMFMGLFTLIEKCWLLGRMVIMMWKNFGTHLITHHR